MNTTTSDINYTEKFKFIRTKKFIFKSKVQPTIHILKEA